MSEEVKKTTEATDANTAETREQEAPEATVPAAEGTVTESAGGAAAPAAPKKKKKLLPIVLVGVLVAGAGTAAGFGIAHMVGEVSEQNYFKNNPTAYCLRGAVRTLEEAGKDDDIFQVVKDSMNQGTLTVRTGMNVDNWYGEGPVDLVQTLSYDLIKGEASFEQSDKATERPFEYGKMPYHLGWFDFTHSYRYNGEKLIEDILPVSSPLMEENNTLHFYTNLDTLSGEYHLYDQQGSYCINSKTVREDFKGSAFDGTDEGATRLYLPNGKQ